MDFSFGSLELNRSNPAHVGNAPLTDGLKSAEKGSASKAKKQSAFQSFLMDAVSNVNQQQLDVASLQEQVVTDPDSVDIHDVTTAMAKAKMSLELAQNVIQRLVGAWNEISTTR